MKESGLVFPFKPLHEVSLKPIKYKLSRRGTQLEPIGMLTRPAIICC